MKKIIIIILALAPALSWAQDANYNLTIKLTTLKTHAKAYLIDSYGWTNQHLIDSVESNNGTFVFKGTVDPSVKQKTILIAHKNENSARYDRFADVHMLYLEKGDIIVTGKDSVKYAVITGSKLNDEYERYSEAALASGDKVVKVINAEFAAASPEKKKDKVFNDSLMGSFRQAMVERDSLKLAYIRKNPDSYFSLVALVEVAGQNVDVPKIEPLYKSLSPQVQGSKLGVEFSKVINDVRYTSIGSIAPDFTQTDTSGKPVTLSSFRGKYVLVDFWASWCGPCRAENPNVAKNYAKYHAKGFQVLGVSLDAASTKANWIKAIHTDGLNWTQVSDLKSWKNDVAVLYGIKSIPQNFLLDPDGKIIARNLRGNDLTNKLAQLFGSM